MFLAMRGLIVAVALACGLAGCGSASPSPATYRAQADAACKRFYAETLQLPVDQYEQQLTGPKVAIRARVDFSKFTRSLRAGVPASEQAQVSALVHTLERPGVTAKRESRAKAQFQTYVRTLETEYARLGLRACAADQRTQTPAG